MQVRRLIPILGDQLSLDPASLVGADRARAAGDTGGNHRDAAKLARNPRLAMLYRTWAKLDAATRIAIRESAAAFLDTLDCDASGG